MNKPNSSVSTAISIRIPNEVLQSVTEYALSRGFVNESGRLDKRGQPNLSAAITELLRHALSPVDTISAALSDSVADPQPLDVRLTALEDRLTTRVSAAIAKQIETLLARDRVDEGRSITPSSQPPQLIANIPQSPSIEKTDTRNRILNAASRGFRSWGYAGTGVNTLAQEAGLTSGAFYGYFSSKEQAFLTVVVAGLEEYYALIETFRASHGANWTVALADHYMSHQHRADLASGCALAALSPEVIRFSKPVRSAYQSELVKLHAAIASGFTTETEFESSDRAWVLLALLLGGINLARAVWDESLSDKIALAVHQATVRL